MGKDISTYRVIVLFAKSKFIDWKKQNMLEQIILPNIFLIGGNDFRFYPTIQNSLRSLTLLEKSLSELYEIGCYNEILNGKFSRPQVFLEKLENKFESNLTCIYYFGHTMRRRDGKIYFAYPASNPKKTSSHIFLNDIVDRYKPSKNRKLLIIVDSEDYSLDSISTKKYEDVLFVFRRFKNSNNTWRNGGELFTGCFAETISNMYQALPSISFRNLFAVIAHRLGFRHADDCVFCCSDLNIINEPVFSISRKTGLWAMEHGNFESDNRGSREDGLQILADALNSIDKRLEANAILDYLSATDPANEVRRAAKGLLSFVNQINFSINKQATPYSKIRSLLPKWLLISSGMFLMGSDSKVDKFSLQEEMPQHEVWLPDFMIAKETVTIEQWDHFLKANGNCIFPKNGQGVEDTSKLPVTGINWYEAIEYAAWLTTQCQIQGIIRPDEEIRLPTEAEWEKAARGINGELYPWGNDFKKNHCNCRSINIGQIIKCGSFSPQGDSPYGVQDMAGNVWEWTISLWGQGGHKPEFAYPYDKYDGRENLLSDSSVRRIVRGGAFYYFDNCVRVATRNVMHPNIRHSGGGFRLVKVQKPNK